MLLNVNKIYAIILITRNTQSMYTHSMNNLIVVTAFIGKTQFTGV